MDCCKECGIYGAVLCRKMGLYANCALYCDVAVKEIITRYFSEYNYEQNKHQNAIDYIVRRLQL